MSLKNVFFVTCITITALFLATGFGLAGEWIWALIAILMTPIWLFARKYADTRLPFICLLASVGLAVVGILTGVSSLWMFLGSGFSLAAWDLLLFSAALENKLSGEPTRLYEIKHIQSLVLALGLGIVLFLLGRSFTIQTPFALLIVFIISVLFGLDRTLGDIRKWRVRR